MARGRMLNKKISQNKSFAVIANETGHGAALFLTWLIAHLDKEGRVHGDPEVLKGLVCPRIVGIDTEVIRQAVGNAHAIGLVEWYEVDGESYIAFPGFERNQVGLRKKREPSSDFPPPSGTLPDDCRQTAGSLPSEGKGSKGKGTQHKYAKAIAPSDWREPPKPILQIPTKGKPDRFDVTEEMIKEWVESFPGLDVLGQLKRARQWCVDNPTKRKTARGARAFLGRWLGKANDQGRFPQPPSDYGRASPSTEFGNGDQPI
jgi:hypothetical protein